MEVQWFVCEITLGSGNEEGGQCYREEKRANEAHVNECASTLPWIPEKPGRTSHNCPCTGWEHFFLSLKVHYPWGHLFVCIPLANS